jgi:alpha-L-fucosidase
VLQEDIRFSQRVESFHIEAQQDGVYKTVYSGTVIGYKKIITFEPAIYTDSLRIIIEDSRKDPKVMFVGVY